MNGLMSISSICGKSVTSWLMRCRHLAMASRSTRASPARAFEQGVGLRAPEHLHGLLGGDRREVERDVLHHLDENAAQAEHQHRAELRVAGHAQDHLAAARAHLLDVDAVDARVGHAAA